MFERVLLPQLIGALSEEQKVVVLYGARQVGKTTLSKAVLSALPGKKLSINADTLPMEHVLSSRDLNRLRALVDGYDLLFIDEAQRISDIGINLKILHDELPSLKILVTGSSSLDLANKVREPLTGRTRTFHLYPVSVEEWRNQTKTNDFETIQMVEEWLVYGLYPEILTTTNRDQKVSYLQELTQSYLYKDILMMGNIRYPEKLGQLLRMIAWQIGNLVSIQELANALQISRDAVMNYLDLLEKSFVIFRLGGFSRNLRKEMTKMSKFYFYDLGLRNMLIGDFNRVADRQDIGALWENFLIIERLKKGHYHGPFANRYFWRTHTGAELDLVEESGGKLLGFEFKWGNQSVRPPASWLQSYPEATFACIHRDQFLPFVSA